MTESLLTNPAPIFEVEGEVRSELSRDVQRLEIEETTAGLKTLSLGLEAQGGNRASAEQRQLYLDGSIVDFGDKLSVVIGATPAAYTVFTGRVSAIQVEFPKEAPESEVTIFAEDKLMNLRM